MNIILNFIKKYKIHLIGWTAFILSEILIIGFATGRFGDVESYVIHYTLNICLFYFSAHLVYPNTFNKKFSWLWKLPILGGLTFVCYLALNYIIDTRILQHQSWKTVQEIDLGYKYVLGVLWRAIIFMGNAGFYYLFLQYLKEINSRELAEKATFQSVLTARETEAKLQQARNSYLKAQINPHLLFNTLSFIYQDVMENSPKAAEAVMSLSDLMRYSVDCEFNEATVPLKDEIAQVKTLINLHSARFEEDLSLNFYVQEGLDEVCFIPLVLITIAENIFKHGIFLDPENPALLQVILEGDYLVLKSKNLPNRKSRPISMNMGLDNIRQRLEIAYGKNASLKYSIKENYFELEIKVKSCALSENTIQKTL